jgi:hypothetical protein
VNAAAQPYQRDADEAQELCEETVCGYYILFSKKLVTPKA